MRSTEAKRNPGTERDDFPWLYSGMEWVGEIEGMLQNSKKIKGSEIMTLQKLYSYTRRAIQDFGMIQDGDKIAIGISGGKDSLTLLYALAGLRNFLPVKFEVIAITVDLGFGEFNMENVSALCEKLGVEYFVLKTGISDIVHEKVKRGSYCAMCAKLRKGALHNFAKAKGCNKIAYAHHQDDFIETMMLSLIYEGQFFTFAPVRYFDKSELTVIRPMIYISESEVKSFRYKNDLPCVKNPCPHDGVTKREYVKQLIAKLNKENPGVKSKMFNAIMKGKIYEY